MYIRVHNPTEVGSSNQGSCSDLTEYLEKENQGTDLENRLDFFDMDREDIKTGEATMLIDDNAIGAKLKKKDTKFYMMSINPSKKELRHIIKRITKRKIKNVSELTPLEKQQYHKELKAYTRNVMERYAENMNRTVNGEKITAKDLVFVAKIEEQRKYRYTDYEVKHNYKNKDNEKELLRNSEGKIIQSGMQKEGLQTHIHVIVSRMDKSKKKQMSPNAMSKGSDKHKIKDKNCRMGFDRVSFAMSCEKDFDKQFQYDRSLEDTTASYLKRARDRKLAGSMSRVVRSDGQVDAVELLNIYVYAVKNGYDMFKDIKSKDKDGHVKYMTQRFDINELSKSFGKSINPKNILISKMHQLNPVNMVKSQLLKVIKSGGMDL